MSYTQKTESAEGAGSHRAPPTQRHRQANGRVGTGEGLRSGWRPCQQHSQVVEAPDERQNHCHGNQQRYRRYESSGRGGGRTRGPRGPVQEGGAQQHPRPGVTRYRRAQQPRHKLREQGEAEPHHAGGGSSGPTMGSKEWAGAGPGVGLGGDTEALSGLPAVVGSLNAMRFQTDVRRQTPSINALRPAPAPPSHSPDHSDADLNSEFSKCKRSHRQGEQRTEQTTEPKAEPKTEPTSGPHAKPTIEPCAESNIEPYREPITEPSTEPYSYTERNTEPRTESLTESYAESYRERHPESHTDTPGQLGQGYEYIEGEWEGEWVQQTALQLRRAGLRLFEQGGLWQRRTVGSRLHHYDGLSDGSDSPEKEPEVPLSPWEQDEEKAETAARRRRRSWSLDRALGDEGDWPESEQAAQRELRPGKPQDEQAFQAELGPSGLQDEQASQRDLGSGEPEDEQTSQGELGPGKPQDEQVTPRKLRPGEPQEEWVSLGELGPGKPQDELAFQAELGPDELHDKQASLRKLGSGKFQDDQAAHGKLGQGDPQDEHASQGKLGQWKPQDVHASQGKLGQGELQDDQASQGKLGQGEPQDDQASQGKLGQGEPQDEQASQGKLGQGEPQDEQASQGKLGQWKPQDVHASQGKLGQGELQDDQASQGKLGQGEPQDDQASQGKLGQGEPQDEQASQGKLGQGKPQDDQASHRKMGQGEPQDDQASQGKLGQGEPQDEHASHRKLGQGEPQDEQASQGKLGQGEPQDEQASQEKLGQGEPQHEQASQGKLGQGEPQDDQASQGKLGQGEPQDEQASQGNLGPREPQDEQVLQEKLGPGKPQDEYGPGEQNWGRRDSLSLAIKDIKEAIQEVKTRTVRSPYTPEEPMDPVWVMRQDLSPTAECDQQLSLGSDSLDSGSASPLGAESTNRHQLQEANYSAESPPSQEPRKTIASFPTYVDVPGPCDPEDLIDGIIFAANYLGSTQLLSDKTPSKRVRMTQAQEAVSQVRMAKTRKKCQQSPEVQSPVTAEVDLFISTQRIKVLNADSQEAMMDHPLRTISYIADIGDIVVLMARRRRPRPRSQEPVEASDPAPEGRGPCNDPAQEERRQYRMICHVFESEDAQLIAQSIGQAFSVAYQEFLRANGIDPEDLSQREYSDLLSTQDMYNDDLIHFSKSENCKDVHIEKQKGAILGVVVVESGWGSILPTVIIANMMHGGPAEKSGRLSIGDQIMSINGTSLVGLPLTTCQSIIKGLKAQPRLRLNIVRCPPVTTVLIRRPDLRYQLGFSVQNGIICSLMRGGIAERGGVRVGHRIIEISGQSVVATPHERIVNILSSAVGEIHMKTMPAAMYRLLTGQEQPVYI